MTLHSFPAPPRAPKGAPNVLLVLTDDVGFGATSTFGGPVPTPNFDRVAARGYRYNRFHTTAMCSPTRAALLTGRNHHHVGFGGLAEMANACPGYTSVIPVEAATLGQILSDNGYDTAWLGKNHNTPLWESTSMGPYDRWPNGYGFGYYYGFFGGAANQFVPALIENRNLVEPPDDPDYILDRDLIDKGIDWLRRQRGLSPDKPFLLYLAPGTAHSPHQAPADWIDRFKGAFDAGWDAVRAATFARQKAMGVIPETAELTPRPDRIPGWDEVPEENRRVYRRMMEAYAGMLAHWDDQFGRILDELEASGQLDNTLIIYIQGDNGASAEGGLEGATNEIAKYNSIEPTIEELTANLDAIGGPNSFSNYPVGWAWAMNTPFQWFKQVASHFGGTRNGLVMSWPERFKGAGEVRDEFHHVVDVLPTILDATGIMAPAERAGVVQGPMDGVSMCYTFGGDAPGREARGQYFELVGHRAFYQDGWIASTTPDKLPWEPGPRRAPEDWRWELYDLTRDYSQSDDLAAAYPEKLTALQEGFAKACAANNVHPIRAGQWFDLVKPMPNPFAGRSDFTYYPSGRRLPGQEFPDLKNRSWRLTVLCQVPAGASGTLITHGGWIGGWSLYMQDGRLHAVYRTADQAEMIAHVVTEEPLPSGMHQVTLGFDFAGPEKSGPATLWLEVDGRRIGEAALPKSIGKLSSASEGVSIGFERGTPVGDGITPPFAFTGRIERIDLWRATPDQNGGT
ncbi:MAG: arylsulfatase [Qingshengfaniella sp.]